MRYCVDYRKRVLEYTKTHTIHETARIFNIGPSTVTRWKSMSKKR
jgi:transposase